ncbi:hypothetical protein [Spiroplasma endosymbiont of Ammophila pubescens]|uniref:hypothetical protein n=1 Tax=Spiroplasma endosymbiont of Ammophila pubescens TaxID=3066315 RepID=UPI0032B2253F
MKKILGFLPLLMLITSGVGSVVSCEMVTNGQNHQKVPITNENLRTFFAENKIFEYQGEFFFKDELEQTKEETDKMTSGAVSSIHKFLLDQTFGEKFRSYFFMFHLNISLQH